MNDILKILSELPESDEIRIHRVDDVLFVSQSRRTYVRQASRVNIATKHIPIMEGELAKFDVLELVFNDLGQQLDKCDI